MASDSTVAPDAREWRIKLKYPDEYKFMLVTWYPALRHSDYHITYKVEALRRGDRQATHQDTAATTLRGRDVYGGTDL